MKTRIIGFLLIVACGMVIAYFMISDNEKLSVINPVKLDDALVDPELRGKMSGHRISTFRLINQLGDTITEKDLEGKIYVADFFFTTCPGICKAMAAQKQRIQEANKGTSDFAILSHSVTPEMDSPEVLFEYGKKYGADPSIWQLTTGDRKEIYRLARKVYFAAKLEPGQSEDDMVHTENFVLVDKEKRIRGIYDGTSESSVDQLIEDIDLLRKSYE